MKKLIRRFSLARVSDSSQSHYSLLRADSPAAPAPSRSFRLESFRRIGKLSSSSSSASKSGSVPEGHVPVYVGEGMERFVVSAHLLNHPIFLKLLNKSAQEYGYDQKGVLHIPCHVLIFERVLEALRVGDASVQDLVDSCSSDDLFL